MDAQQKAPITQNKTSITKISVRRVAVDGR